jgi:hypothetical protein
MNEQFSAPYITNPMSSADMDLLSTYRRPELQGRPLDGTLVVRVWDEDGLQFNALQDVQLVRPLTLAGRIPEAPPIPREEKMPVETLGVLPRAAQPSRSN